MSRSGHPPRTTLLADVVWRKRDHISVEHCRFLELADSIIIDGRVLSGEDGPPHRVDYTIRCDRDWRTQVAHVRIVEGLTTRELELARLDTGGWRRDHENVVEGEGLLDVDLSITPATNTIPIRRLGLAVDESATVDALWVGIPELRLEHLTQTYVRTGETTFRYESDGGSFAAKLEVDGEGVITTYGDLWERVAPG